MKISAGWAPGPLFSLHLLILALIGSFDICVVSGAKLKLIYYTEELALDDAETWRQLGRAFNGSDSRVQFSVEKCLPESEPVCDALCDSRVIYEDDRADFTYYSHEADFQSTLRYTMHRLATFNCSTSTIKTCTSAADLAESLVQKTPEELAALEANINDRLADYKYVDALGSLVRELCLVETLLSEHIIKTNTVKMTEKEKVFYEWLLKQDVYFGPMLWPVHTENGRGVLAHRNIKPNDVLFESKNVQLTPSIVRALFNLSTPDSGTPDETDGWSPFFELVAFLAVQVELGDKAPLEPYVSMLRESVNSGVFEWSEEELNQLEDEKFVDAIEGIKQVQRKYFAMWGDHFHFDKKHWHFDVFQWAFHVVSSRKFDLQEPTLIIFLDMLNHSENFGIQLKFVFTEEDGSTAVIALDEVRRGDEIFLHYSNDVPHLLYTYGFIPRPTGCIKHHDEGSREALIEYYKCAKYRSENNLS